MPFAIAMMTKLCFVNCAIYSSLILEWEEDKFICSISAHHAIALPLSLK